jgi:hypothetical protein
MESNDYRINTEKIETKPPTTGKSKKVKKKSAIAKLTEKRRASESGSEFGSTVSLRSNCSKVLPESGENININKKGDNSKLDASNDSKDIEISNLKGGDNLQTDTISSKINDIKQDNISLNLNTDNKKDTTKDKLGSSTLETTDKKDNSANVKVIRNIEDDKPTPKPRSLKVISDASDISPSNYMEVDSDSDEKDKKVDNDLLSSKAPSDATVKRFRALKVANQRSESLESLKNSPFVPKPPDTPKSGRRPSKYLSKGEKRNRDPNSSSEEPDNSAKTKKQENDDVFIAENKSNSNNISRSEMGSKSDLKNNDDKNDVQMSPGRDSKIGSEVDLAQITENYKHVLQNDTGSLGFGKLPPLSPISHPPPLPGDVSSRSLRTKYKVDTSYKKVDKSSYDSVSNRSSVSSAVMTPISIKEARSRLR